MKANRIDTDALSDKESVDLCTEQNQHIKSALCLLKLFREDIKSESIEIKFLLSGYTYFPSDADFVVMDAHAINNPYIYNPSDWYHIIENSKRPFQRFRNKSPRCVFYKTFEDDITNRKRQTQTALHSNINFYED